MNKVKYYIPVLKWIQEYKIKEIKYDLISGISVGLLLIPQSLSVTLTLILMIKKYSMPVV